MSENSSNDFLKAFAERMRHNPEDTELRLEFAEQLFAAEKYYETIPHLQAVRMNPWLREKVSELCVEVFKMIEGPDDDLPESGSLAPKTPIQPSSGAADAE